MMDEPRVSIMIPTYNQSHWLGTAVDSALAQDYQNLEIVIADDRSTDGTDEVLKKYMNDSRIKIFTNASNLGRVANYRHTLENHVSGDWVVNLDGDDHYTDNSFISSAIDQINKVPGAVFVQAGHNITDPDGKLLGIALPSIKNDVEVIDGTDYFLNFHHFSHLGSLFNRKAAVETGFYTHDILSADIECFLRLALQGKVILMRKAVGAWVHHTGNESKKLSVDAVEKNMARYRSPYDDAIRQGKIPAQHLNAWLKKNTDGYLLNYLTIYFSDRQRIPGYLNHVLRKYPHILLSTILPKALLKGLISKTKNTSKSKAVR